MVLETYNGINATYASYDALLAGELTYQGVLDSGLAAPTQYKGGRFPVPGTTGPLKVSGVGFSPDAVVFIGSNVATENAVVTGNNLGVFMGFMGRHYSSGALLSYAVSVLPEQGARTASKPIVQSATWNTQEYAASAVSLDADGFTVNFDDVGTGVVYWLAIQSADVATIPNTIGSVPLGFVGKSMLALCYRAGSADINADVQAGLHHAGFGGGGFRAGRTPEQGGGYVYMVSGGSARHEVGTGVNQAAQFVIASGSYSGSFLSLAQGSGKPTGTGFLNFQCSPPNQNSAYWLVWDAECTNGYANFAAGAGNHADSSTLFNPALQRAFAMVGYTVADSPQNSNGPSAVLGLSLACEDADGQVFQASVFCDGVAAPKTLYQSPTAIVADVDGTNVFTVGIDFVAAGPGKFRLTTLVDGTGAPGNFVFHAFGGELPEVEALWIPQIYRRILSN